MVVWGKIESKRSTRDRVAKWKMGKMPARMCFKSNDNQWEKRIYRNGLSSSLESTHKAVQYNF